LEVTVFTASLLFGESPVPGDIEIRTPRFNRGWRFKFPLRALAHQVRNEVWRRNPDLVVVCGVTDLAGFLLGMDCAERLMIWEFSNASPGNPLVNWKAARLLNRSRAVLSPSASIDEQIRANYHYDGTLLRLPFWIEQAKCEQDEGSKTKSYDFIYLGRRDPEKGLFELISACANVVQKRPNLKVLIAGPGDESRYREHAEALRVANKVEFIFFATEEETMMALSSSRYLVLPSYHEGYPLVLLEAAMFGVPFIATQVGSVPEMVGRSEAGLLVPPRDKGALARMMLQVLDEPTDAYERRCSAARELFTDLAGPTEIQRLLEQLANYHRA
jgi:glycosyltransferase involved in cell wall biosynthesis